MAQTRVLLGRVQGDKGDTGDTGPSGAAATVTIGTTTTGAPGSSATVTEAAGSTAQARILDFAIPRGEPGAGADAVLIPNTAGTDLDTYRLPGLFYNPATASANIAHQPYANPFATTLAGLNGAFALTVEQHVGLVQTYVAATTNRTFRRSCPTPTGAWGEWVEMLSTTARGTTANVPVAAGFRQVSSNSLPAMFRNTVDIGQGSARVLGAWKLWNRWNNGVLYILESNRMIRAQRWTLTAPYGRDRDTDPQLQSVTIPFSFAVDGFMGCVSWESRGRGWNYDTESDYYMESDGALWWDIYGLVFTRSRKALWMHYRSPGSQTFEFSEITLAYLPNYPITAMWAGLRRDQDFWMSTADIWVVCNNQLYKHTPPQNVRYENTWSGRPHPQFGTHWYGWMPPADMYFQPISSASLPTAGMRIHAPSDPGNNIGHVVVWGTAPANRVAYGRSDNYGNYTWYTLTTPFNHNGAAGVVCVYNDGSINAVATNGDIYRCLNPTSGASATWTLLFRSFQYMPMLLPTHAISPNNPVTISRNTSNNRISGGLAWPGVTAQDQDGWTNPVAPVQTWAELVVDWPSEPLCHGYNGYVVTGLRNASQGYAQLWGIRNTRANILQDGRSFNAATSIWGTGPYGSSYEGFPPALQWLGLPTPLVSAWTTTYSVADPNKGAMLTIGIP